MADEQRERLGISGHPKRAAIDRIKTGARFASGSARQPLELRPAAPRS
jgi:hypothetical protein